MYRRRRLHLLFFFFNDTATTEIYTLSLHDALPISDRAHVAGILYAVEDQQRPARIARSSDRIGGRALAYARDGHHPLGRHGLGGRPVCARGQGHTRLRVERQLVAFAHDQQLELQAGGFSLREHARTFQEDETWLAPVSESSKTTDDLVVRAADQLVRTMRGNRAVSSHCPRNP